MKYLFTYFWKLLYFIIGIIVVVGITISGMKISKMLTDQSILQLLMAVIIWISGSFIVLKPLSMIDTFLTQKASLDTDARLYFFMFMTFVLISVGVFTASIYLFNEWLELINDTVNRTLDDYFTIIFPLVLFIASIGTFAGSFKLYKKYNTSIKEK
ncbi:MAG TPA: hypothetical protein VIN02_07225 [Sulfurovum sp.]